MKKVAASSERVNKSDLFLFRNKTSCGTQDLKQKRYKSVVYDDALFLQTHKDCVSRLAMVPCFYRPTKTLVRQDGGAMDYIYRLPISRAI